MIKSIAEISHLTKVFSLGKKPALNDITFTLPRGEITGLIGPDGAGKTTLIRLLLGLLRPSQGKIRVLDLDPVTETKDLHQKTGYMPQKFGLYEDLTVLENMNLYADLNGLTEQEKRTSFKKLLAMTNLTPFTERLAGNLSGGMKQKLGLVCSLLGHPDFLLLDEPSVGVDPISRRELMKLVRDLTKSGITVLWSTSYLDEAEQFDQILLLNDGKLLFQGNPKELTNSLDGSVFLTQNTHLNNRRLLRQILKSQKPIIDAVIQGDSVRIVMTDKNLQRKYDTFLKQTTPRFEDAVIKILGGAPMHESLVAQNISVSEAASVMIEADHLTKQYGNFTAANDITFQIKRGEIFGLLGPNGAGKSTSFKMMCGLSKPTSGNALITGIDMNIDPTKARSKLGYMAQKFSLFSPLSVLQNLRFFAGIYGLKGSDKKNRIDQMIDVFNLSRYLGTPSGTLPLGYKQRLALACAIMHNPPILFLDEPTSGVDPLTRREFWNHINSMVEKGVTVMVTTHFMDEAEYCDRIALIYQGNAIRIGSPSQLKKQGETMEDAFIRLICEYDQKHEVKK